MNVYTNMTAVLSKEKTPRYRYELTREWALAKNRKPKTVTFIMLNPSTADDKEDDPTIKRCVAFARDNGANRLIVANLFAYRTSSVSELKEMRTHDDIVGPEYWDRLAATVRKSQTIILGWGKDGGILEQDKAVLEFLKLEVKGTFYCLTINKDGSPKHPLYIRGSAPLIPFVKGRDNVKSFGWDRDLKDI